MIAFMTGVLGSLVFWIGFFIVGLFAGTFFLKKMAPSTYKFVTTGRITGPLCWAWEAMAIVLIIYLFWPILLLGLTIGLTIKIVLWKPFCGAVKFADKNMPSKEWLSGNNDN